MWAKVFWEGMMRPRKRLPCQIEYKREIDKPKFPKGDLLWVFNGFILIKGRGDEEYHKL